MSVPDGDRAARFVPPSPASLIGKVADTCSTSCDVVDGVLRDSGIVLRSPMPASRRIQVMRLCISGVKHTGEPIAFEQRFGPGVWAIVHRRNSAGKTSLLECVVWPLRGEPRDLPPDVRSWLRRISLDAIIGGRFIRVVIENDVDASHQTVARLLQAAGGEELLSSTDAQLTSVLSASNTAEVECVIGELVLDALGLERTAIWNPRGGQDGEGATQRHGWASYFGACYLNPGGDKLLFGDVSQSQSLSARLLELFVAVPYASTLTHLKAIGKRQAKDERQARQRVEQDQKARSADRKKWTDEREATRAEIASLQRAVDSAVSADLAATDGALATLRQARQEAVQAEEALFKARDARIVAEQRALDAEETWQARRVLGLLDPVCCPRCEVPLEPDRRAEEKHHASCSVCTRPLPAADADLAEGVISELRDAVTEARQGEEKAAAESEQRAQAVRTATAAYERARARFDAARLSTSYHRLRELELLAARLDGQLAATGSSPAPTSPTGAGSDQIIDTLSKMVEATVREATDAVFPLLDRNIVDLARSFGVENLDSVRLQRNGHVNAVKAGKPTPFGDFSRGDRLRMRIATVIAMLRVGAQLGTRPHPGLLLIDAVGSEEVTIEPGQALITELNRLASELPDLQVILTTANPDLVVDVLPAERVITTTRDHLF